MNDSLPYPQGESVTRSFSAREFVKVRATTDGQDSFLVWQGAIYALIPEQPKQHLFNMLGMSVARCLENPAGGWDFTSRELTYYLHPETGEIRHQWQNPWTNDLLTVMHVANSPVQGRFNRPFTAKVIGNIATFGFDLFPCYPNPLAAESEFAPYSPQPTYQAVELFKLTVPIADLENPDLTTVSSLLLSWERIGPWLPWMKMGQQPGQLIYSASGYKVANFEGLPQRLQTEIQQRVPLYRHAPRQKLDVEDMTSWSAFKQNFQAYLRGEQFPLPAAAE